MEVMMVMVMVTPPKRGDTQNEGMMMMVIGRFWRVTLSFFSQYALFGTHPYWDS